VDEVLAVEDAEFQKKMLGQNEEFRRPWPHDSVELKKEQRLIITKDLTKDSIDIILYEL
jgi:hypothetical protein